MSLLNRCICTIKSINTMIVKGHNTLLQCHVKLPGISLSVGVCLRTCITTVHIFNQAGNNNIIILS